MRLLFIGLSIIILASHSHATLPEIIHLMEFDFQQIGPLLADAPVTFRLTLTRNEYTMNSFFKVRLESINGVQIIGLGEWTDSVDARKSYEKDFQIVIPGADTSGLKCHLDFGVEKTNFPVFFVPTVDGVKRVGVDPRVHAKILAEFARDSAWAAERTRVTKKDAVERR